MSYTRAYIIVKSIQDGVFPDECFIRDAVKTSPERSQRDFISLYDDEFLKGFLEKARCCTSDDDTFITNAILMLPPKELIRPDNVIVPPELDELNIFMCRCLMEWRRYMKHFDGYTKRFIMFVEKTWDEANSDFIEFVEQICDGNVRRAIDYAADLKVYAGYSFSNLLRDIREFGLSRFCELREFIRNYVDERVRLECSKSFRFKVVSEFVPEKTAKLIAKFRSFLSKTSTD